MADVKYSEEQLINEMINNSAYSSDSIRTIAQNIAPIMVENNCEMPKTDGVYFNGIPSKALDMFEGFYNMLKKDGREDALDYTLSLMTWLRAFNDTQLDLINQYVLITGTVPFAFFDSNITASIPYGKLNWIFKAIDAGYTEIFIDNFNKIIEYSVDQLGELYTACDEGLYYAKPGYIDNLPPANIMAIMRHAIGLGMEFDYDPNDHKLTIY